MKKTNTNGKHVNRLTYWLAIIGGFIGLVGGSLSILKTYFDVKEQINPPRIEILGVRPVYVGNIGSLEGENGKLIYPGITFLVQIKSLDRRVSINGLQIEGKKALNYDEIHSYFFSKHNKSYVENNEIESIRVEKKPYFEFDSWGLLEDWNQSKTLDPFTIEIFKFTILKPESSLHLQPTDDRYLGIDPEEKHPIFKKRIEFVWDLFKKTKVKEYKWFVPTSLVDEIIKGELRVNVVTGGKKFSIDPKLYRDIAYIGQEDLARINILDLFDPRPF